MVTLRALCSFVNEVSWKLSTIWLSCIKVKQKREVAGTTVLFSVEKKEETQSRRGVLEASILSGTITLLRVRLDLIGNCVFKSVSLEPCYSSGSTGQKTFRCEKNGFGCSVSVSRRLSFVKYHRNIHHSIRRNSWTRSLALAPLVLGTKYLLMAARSCSTDAKPFHLDVVALC